MGEDCIIIGRRPTRQVRRGFERVCPGIPRGFMQIPKRQRQTVLETGPVAVRDAIELINPLSIDLNMD